MSPRRNPYVGPRPFEQGEALFGRERETNDLLHLLLAERIVLLYSPSGAGKTSLIQAGLLPRLAQEEFTLLPVMRVSRRSAAPDSGNRYVLSLLFSLEQGMPEAQRLPAAQLSALSLADYLDRREADKAEESVALIFDQFEEILTVDPTDRAGKDAFFAQVGTALRKRNRWALFSMRQEYRAGLDPYLRPLPTRFSSTYRLDLLEERAARLAIQQPAQRAGVTFLDDAAQHLVDELRRPHAPHGDVGLAPPLGLYIEPMQLQVVCRRLFEHLPPDAQQITAQDVTQAGQVDTALADYYADTVRQFAAQTQVAERVVREWFDARLITPQGIRSQVLREPERSGGLDNRVIGLLEDSHLVRAEARRGETWYELSHDRLIAPVRLNNAEWFTANLSTLQRQAKLWDENHRQAGFLLTGQALADVAQSANANAAALNSTELDFLRESQSAEAGAAREQAVKDQEQELKSERAVLAVERTGNKRIRQLAIGAILVSLLALGAFLGLLRVFVQLTDAQRQTLDAQSTAVAEAGNAVSAKATAVAERGRAEEQTRSSNSRRLAIQSASNRESQFDLSLLLGLEALRLDANVEARGNLGAAMFTNPGLSAALHGHTDSVYTVRFSPDGALLASAGADYNIILWDAAARRPIAPPLRGHTAEVSAVAFSPDGLLLASVGRDQTVRLWDVVGRRPLGESFAVYTSNLYCVAFSPDGRTLAVGGDDATIILWDVASRTSVGEPFAGHRGTLVSLAFSPDGRTLLSGSRDQTVRLWDVATHRPLGQPLTGHRDGLNSVAYSPDGKSFVSASDDQTIVLWDAATREPIGAPFLGHDSVAASVAFSPDGARLISGSADQTISLWDVATRERIATFAGQNSPIYSVAFSPDGRTLASGGNNRDVVLWDVPARLATAPLMAHTNTVNSVAFSPDGKTLASGSADTTIRLWDVATHKPLGEPLTGHAGFVNGVAFSPDGRTLASGSADRTVRLWDVSTHQPIGRPLARHTAFVTALAFSSDGRTLASASLDGTIILWSVSTLEPIDPPLVGHRSGILAVAFSPDGATLASGSLDRTIRMWNTSTHQLIGEPLAGHTNSVRTVAFSRNGKTLVSGSLDHTLQLWDVATRLPIGRPLTGHGSVVGSVAFSPDGTTLASGSEDKTVRLWDVATRQAIGEPFTAHTNTVSAVAFSPDGKLLASGSHDNTIILADVDEHAWPARACRIANRNLTRAEWAQYIDPDPATYRATCPDLPLEPQ